MKQPYVITVYCYREGGEVSFAYLATKTEIDSQGVLRIYETGETADNFTYGNCIATFAAGMWTRVEKHPNEIRE